MVGIALIFLFGLFTDLVLMGCASQSTLTPVSAAYLASQIANEQCAKQYGETPFTPDDFEAAFINGRWEWGTKNGGKVNGYEVEVSFLGGGGKKVVLVQGPISQ